MIIPENDIRLAEVQGRRFDVCVKNGRGKPWTTMVSDVDLVEAIEKATHIAENHYEVGVITVDGYIYWSSLNPHLFNTTVLERKEI